MPLKPNSIKGEVLTINKEIWGDVAVLVVEGTLRRRPEVAPFHDRIERARGSLPRMWRRSSIGFIRWRGRVG